MLCRQKWKNNNSGQMAGGILKAKYETNTLTIRDVAGNVIGCRGFIK